MDMLFDDHVFMFCEIKYHITWVTNVTCFVRVIMKVFLFFLLYLYTHIYLFNSLFIQLWYVMVGLVGFNTYIF